MKYFRVVLLALGAIHALLAGFTALVGGFADGGSIGERAVLMAVLILSGNIRGDWLLPLIFSVVPLIGLVYAAMVLSRRAA